MASSQKTLQFFPYCLLCLLSALTTVQASEMGPDYVLDMDIEDLMTVEVISVSKYGQLLKDAPAAVTVIDREQIRNSGMEELPELLRLAPGMQVIRSDAGGWFASARSLFFGANGKMLVMADGRSIYSQDAGSVIWQNQSFFLEDIDRIEVIRGPGGTTWGYNAVYGIVNIISRPVRETQGFLTDTLVGSDGNLVLQSRYGGQIGENLFYRLFIGGSDRDQFENPNGTPVHDMLKKRTGGFRLDYSPSSTTSLILEGAVHLSTDDFSDSENRHKNHFLSTRVSHSLTPGMDIEFQGYYNRSRDIYYKTDFGQGYGVTIEDISSELHLDWRLAGRNRIVAGGGLKYSVFMPEDGFFIDFLNNREVWHFSNIFFSDELTIIPDRLWLTGGVKLEHNSKSNLDWQPNIRLLYKSGSTQSIWMALSRALKMPDYQEAANYIENYPEIDPDTGETRDITVVWTGQPLKNEKFISYEIGYRTQLTSVFSTDIAFFYNKSTNVSTYDFNEESPDVFVSFFKYNNTSSAYGSEISFTCKPEKPWSATASYSYLNNRLSYSATNNTDKIHIHRLQFHANYRFSEKLNLNSHFYWNSEVSLGNTSTPEYMRMDLGLTYRLSDTIILSLTGQNLLDNTHREIDDTVFSFYNTEIPRTVLLNFTLNL